MFKAHRLFNHSTLGSRVINKEKSIVLTPSIVDPTARGGGSCFFSPTKSVNFTDLIFEFFLNFSTYTGVPVRGGGSHPDECF